MFAVSIHDPPDRMAVTPSGFVLHMMQLNRLYDFDEDGNLLGIREVEYERDPYMEVLEAMANLRGETALLMDCLLYTSGYQALQIPKSSFAESVSIPMQQIGYAATHEEITAEEKTAIEEFIPVDVLDEVYVPWTSDKIKFNEHFSSAAINNRCV